MPEIERPRGCRALWGFANPTRSVAKSDCDIRHGQNTLPSSLTATANRRRLLFVRPDGANHGTVIAGRHANPGADPPPSTWSVGAARLAIRIAEYDWPCGYRKRGSLSLK